MANVTVSTIIDRPVEEVWDDVRHLASHVEWMADAVAIRFTTPTTSGVGTTFECDTRIGPLRTTDVMEVTEWVEGERIGVRHVGLVTGVGVFTLEPQGPARTRFQWDERLSFPLWLGGPVTAWLARPVLAAVWRRNLTRLQARLNPTGGSG